MRSLLCNRSGKACRSRFLVSPGQAHPYEYLLDANMSLLTMARSARKRQLSCAPVFVDAVIIGGRQSMSVFANSNPSSACFFVGYANSSLRVVVSWAPRELPSKFCIYNTENASSTRLFNSVIIIVHNYYLLIIKYTSKISLNFQKYQFVTKELINQSFNNII